MDVIHDYSFAAEYFYAADAENAALAIVSGPQDTGFDAVDAKGVDPVMALGHLVAFISRQSLEPRDRQDTPVVSTAEDQAHQPRCLRQPAGEFALARRAVAGRAGCGDA